MARRVPQLLLAVALASFMLPFFALVREGQQLLQFTGTELVAGTTFQPGSPFAALGHVRPQPLAVVAFGAAAAAWLLSLARPRWARAVAAALAALAALSLGRLRLPLRIEARPGAGYYLAMLSVLAAAGLLAAFLLRAKPSRPPTETG